MMRSLKDRILKLFAIYKDMRKLFSVSKALKYFPAIRFQMVYRFNYVVFLDLGDTERRKKHTKIK